MKGEQAMFKRALHPGSILKDELDALGVSPTEFARQIDVPPNRVGQIISGKRSITGDSALRFGHWFGTDPQFWLNLQVQFDLTVAASQTGGAIRKLPTRTSLPPRAGACSIGGSPPIPSARQRVDHAEG
jgi:addiction module HigA family antidote